MHKCSIGNLMDSSTPAGIINHKICKKKYRKQNKKNSPWIILPWCRISVVHFSYIVRWLSGEETILTPPAYPVGRGRVGIPPQFGFATSDSAVPDTPGGIRKWGVNKKKNTHCLWWKAMQCTHRASAKIHETSGKSYWKLIVFHRQRGTLRGWMRVEVIILGVF